MYTYWGKSDDNIPMFVVVSSTTFAWTAMGSLLRCDDGRRSDFTPLNGGKEVLRVGVVDTRKKKGRTRYKCVRYGTSQVTGALLTMNACSRISEHCTPVRIHVGVCFV